MHTISPGPNGNEYFVPAHVGEGVDGSEPSGAHYRRIDAPAPVLHRVVRREKYTSCPGEPRGALLRICQRYLVLVIELHFPVSKQHYAPGP